MVAVVSDRWSLFKCNLCLYNGTLKRWSLQTGGQLIHSKRRNIIYCTVSDVSRNSFKLMQQLPFYEIVPHFSEVIAKPQNYFKNDCNVQLDLLMCLVLSPTSLSVTLAHLTINCTT